MSAFDRLAKIMALTQSLGGNDFRDSQAMAMRAGAMGNMAMLPFHLQEMQQQLEFAPQRHEAEMQNIQLDQESKTVDNLARISGAVRSGDRGLLEARDINLEGVPTPLNPDEALQAFQAVVSGAGLDSLPPEIIQRLQYDPRLNQMMQAFQSQLQ